MILISSEDIENKLITCRLNHSPLNLKGTAGQFQLMCFGKGKGISIVYCIVDMKLTIFWACCCTGRGKINLLCCIHDTTFVELKSPVLTGEDVHEHGSTLNYYLEPLEVLHRYKTTRAERQHFKSGVSRRKKSEG